VRPLWIIRLIFYPAAIGLTALLLADRLDAGEPDVSWLLGTTAQDRQFELMVQEGRPRHFDTHLVADCSDGDTWYVHWYRPENAGVLRFRAPSFAAEESYTSGTDKNGRWWTSTLRMDGTLGDGVASGRVSMTGRIKWLDGRTPVTCRTGPLPFSARRAED
jgi:hypothetical protein